MTFPEKLEVAWHSPLESANEAHLVVAGGRVKARGKQNFFWRALAGIVQSACDWVLSWNIVGIGAMGARTCLGGEIIDV
jgi:hypothetical protein